jgi:hypothetical protein
LGRVNKVWLLLKEESGRCFIGHGKWFTAKPQQQYVNDKNHPQTDDVALFIKFHDARPDVWLLPGMRQWRGDCWKQKYPCQF